MSTPLIPCPGCRRHLRATETRCPFCARAVRVSPLLLAGTLALASHAQPAHAARERPATLTRQELVAQGGATFIAQYGVPPRGPDAGHVSVLQPYGVPIRPPPPRVTPPPTPPRNRLRPPRRPERENVPAYGVSPKD